LYSCVGIRAGRFVCSVLTLEVAMSGEVRGSIGIPKTSLSAYLIGKFVFLNFVLMCCDMDLDQEVLDCVMSG